MRISHHLAQLAVAPPWYVRLLGAVFLLGSLGVYLLEATLARHVESSIELIGHLAFALLGVTMFYPEGAAKLMSFARKTVPLLDRRTNPRTPPDHGADT